MTLTDEQIAALRDGTEGVTPGPWKPFICDDGKQWSGWPLSIEAVNIVDKSIVRPGGFYPYEWDAKTSQHEACTNAAHIARCDPDTVLALATEVLETRALLASFDEDRLEEIITDSIDVDWTPRDAARAIVRAMKGGQS